MSVQIAEKAMLLRLHVSQWSGQKHDREISDEVATQHNARADAGRYQKSLLAKGALSTIQQVAQEARLYIYGRTLPWLDDGYRILPAVSYLDVATGVHERKCAFESAVSDFVGNYPSYVENARVALNGMFKEADYPSAEQIAAKFRFDFMLQSVPNGTDFRVQLGEEEIQRIQQDIEARVAEQMEEASKEPWRRIRVAVSHMADKLGAYKPAVDGQKAEGIFRNSLVGNIRELVDVLPSLNLTEDPDLRAIIKRMDADLATYDADDLREDAILRAQTKQRAEDILSAMSGYIGAA